MERKIGEIFEHNGEWYQALEQTGKICEDCYFHFDNGCFVSSGFGWCRYYSRNDNKSIIFKKLEKVGEPFTIVGTLYQYYKVFDIDNVCGNGFWCVHNYKSKILTVEIKQNKEAMEEKKIQHYECFFDGKSSKSNLKPFDLNAAKQGKPVCTRDGRKARIICFDRNNQNCQGKKYPIVALITGDNGVEEIGSFDNNGKLMYDSAYCDSDLMMLPEKKEGWVNIDWDCNAKRVTIESEEIYDTKEDALQNVSSQTHKDTVKIEWEE